MCGGAAARGRGGQRVGDAHVRAREQQGARIAVVPPVRGGSCAAPRSGRARSKHRRRPQLCAKPPLQRLAARHPSASSLPALRWRGAPFCDFGLVSAASVAACARCGWHVGASGRIERLWTDPGWRSSPAGPGRSAAPAAHGRHDRTFRAPSQPGGLMCARDEDEAQATSPGPGRLVWAPSRAARSVRPHCHCLRTTAHHLLTAPSSLRASVLRHSRLMVLALCTRRWRPRTTA